MVENARFLLALLLLASPAQASQDAEKEQMVQESQIVNELLIDVQAAKDLGPEQVDGLISRINANLEGLKNKDVIRFLSETIEPYLNKLTEARSKGRVYNPSGRDHREKTTDVLGRGLPDQLVKKDPKNPYGWSRRGRNSILDQDWQGGFEDLAQALRLGADDADTYAGYAAAAFNLGDTKLAAASAAAALKRDPNHAGALALLKLAGGKAPTAKLPSAFGPEESSVAQEQPSRQLTAEQVAAEIQKQIDAPASPAQKSSALTRSAGSSLTVKDYSSAYALASKAIEFNERNAQAWTYRAIADNKLRHYLESVQDASAALRFAPDSAAALQTRSNSFSRMRRFSDGLADADRTLERQPSNGQAYFNRAFALAGLGQRAEALEALRRSAEVDQRFMPRYEEAVQVPQDQDLLFLFDDKPAAIMVRTEPLSPQARMKRFLRLLLTTLMGGVLVALGLLHVLSAGWREKARNTIRRALARAPEAGPAPAAAGFWSQYTLSREIGSGGMGVVYEARDNSLGRSVAVKKMRDEIRVDPQERRRFVDEARTVASLHHPHIVDIYAVVEEENDVYLVFEYIDGSTLSDLIADKGSLPFEEARRILKSVCAAVDCAHRQNVIHRDLKPSNIMLTREGSVKVMDFGVARQAKDAVTKLSMTNTIVGTPPYMAPEQEQGTVRKESDVFALGICFYELLTGRLPFSGQGAGLLLNKINGKHAAVSGVQAGLPSGLDAVFAKALCPDPDKRYRSPAELYAAVEALCPARVG